MNPILVEIERDEDGYHAVVFTGAGDEQRCAHVTLGYLSIADASAAAAKWLEMQR